MDILEGIRVIDLTTWAFCPSAGCVLAHWGADVIKVENPNAPDPMRLMDGPIQPGRPNIVFRHYNRGKRAMAIDLTKPEGRDVLYSLVEKADVFLTSYLPRTRKKLEIDVADIRRINPRIIFAKGTGQGPKGPEAELGGYDGATWWCRGSLANSAMEVSGAQTPTGMVGHGDGMSGMTFAGGICAGLLKRERSGEAPIVDASLLATAIWFNGMQIHSTVNAARAPVPATPRSATYFAGAGMAHYRTKDGRFLKLHFMSDYDRDWLDLYHHIERPDLAQDPRFAGGALRIDNRVALMAILEEVFASATLADWRKRLATMSGVWAPVQTAAEMAVDQQALANEFVQQVDYADGPFTIVSPPILFDEKAGRSKRAPEFAEHTDEIMREFGYSPEKIASLKASVAIA